MTDIEQYFSKLGDYYESAGAELEVAVKNIHSDRVCAIFPSQRLHIQYLVYLARTHGKQPHEDCWLREGRTH